MGMVLFVILIFGVISIISLILSNNKLKEMKQYLRKNHPELSKDIFKYSWNAIGLHFIVDDMDILDMDYKKLRFQYIMSNMALTLSVLVVILLSRAIDYGLLGNIVDQNFVFIMYGIIIIFLPIALLWEIPAKNHKDKKLVLIFGMMGIIFLFSFLRLSVDILYAAVIFGVLTLVAFLGTRHVTHHKH